MNTETFQARKDRSGDASAKALTVVFSCLGTHLRPATPEETGSATILDDLLTSPIANVANTDTAGKKASL